MNAENWHCRSGDFVVTVAKHVVYKSETDCVGDIKKDWEKQAGEVHKRCKQNSIRDSS